MKNRIFKSKKLDRSNKNAISFLAFRCNCGINVSSIKPTEIFYQPKIAPVIKVCK